MKKKILIILIAIIILLQNNIFAYFDVEGTWAEPYINWATERGIFQGYKDNSFRPRVAITNAEYIKVLSDLIKTNNSVKSNFIDVPDGAWYKKHLEKFLSLNLIENRGNFNPNEKITRLEAFRLLSGVYGLSSDVKENIEFNDAKIVDNRAGLITLVNDKIITGDTNGNLNPLDAITRAEICKILKMANDKYLK